MEASIKGTRTEKNLLKAFAGESQAKNRYEFAAKVAKEEGYEQIAAIFLETAENEKEHAKRFFNFLEGGALEITAKFPAGKVGTTAENLKASAEGEHEETKVIYPEAAKIAEQEGFNDVAAAFKLIAAVEAHHEKRYRALLENVEKGKVYKRSGKVQWKCMNCGHIHTGENAPEQCPTCLHPKAYFEVACECYI